MGNSGSTNNIQQNPQILQKSNNVPLKPEVVMNEEDIFQKIVDVSNQLFLEYNNEYLNDKFCDKLAIIYQKKLYNFNIKLLRAMNNKISSDEIDNDFLLEFQYIPKNEEDNKFFVEIFKENLKDVFWGQNIGVSDELFLKNGIKVSNGDLSALEKYSKKSYISFKHVNNLLDSFNNSASETRAKVNDVFKKEELIKKNEQKTQNGGASSNIINYARRKTNELYGKNNQLSQMAQNRNRMMAQTNNKSGSRTVHNQAQEFINGTGNGNNSTSSKNGFSNKNGKRNNNNGKPENNSSQAFKKREAVINNIQQPIRYNKSPVEKTNAALNSVVNSSILENNASDEEVNKYIKYSVPKYYKSPTIFCPDEKQCTLTKKEICKALTENFIVRNNIIAAILNTLPKKHIIKKNKAEDKIVYDGGLCYQKFKNLFLCKVCVPYNYRELRNKDMKDILKHILEKSEFLTEEECHENKGYFLQLNLDEKAALINKTRTIKKEELEYFPQIKYNLFYLECIEKLKKSYFDNLDALLQILLKIQKIPIINNSTLNLIGEETKNIINNMYNLCNYYYVFAIVALINSDIS